MEDTIAHEPVQIGDVLMLKVAKPMTPQGKQKLLEWFCGALAGTSLEGCRVILLDDGMDVELMRGERTVV